MENVLQRWSCLLGKHAESMSPPVTGPYSGYGGTGKAANSTMPCNGSSSKHKWWKRLEEKRPELRAELEGGGTAILTEG